MARAEQPFLLLKLDGAYLKWGKPELGSGARVRYAFVNQPMNFPGARNCGALRPLGPALERFSVAGPQLRAEAAAAFAMWGTCRRHKFRTDRRSARGEHPDRRHGGAARARLCQCQL
jgi:hypothetical protein